MTYRRNWKFCGWCDSWVQSYDVGQFKDIPSIICPVCKQPIQKIVWLTEPKKITQ